MASSLNAQFTGKDNFDDNSLNSSLWTNLVQTGSAVFTETDQRLEFTAEDEGFSLQYLTWGSPSYDSNFDIFFRTANSTFPESSGDFAAIGIEIYPSGSNTIWLNARHGSYFVSNNNYVGASRDVLSSFFLNSAIVTNSARQPETNFPKAAAIRISFDSSTKVFSIYYDDVPTDGITWTLLGTYGVETGANADSVLDFGMAQGDFFDVFVYGLSNNVDVDAGELLIDDFQAVSGPATAPTAALVDGFTIKVETQLGKAYTVKRSTNLASTFTAMDVVGNGETFRLVPSGEGTSTFTGNGDKIILIDTTISDDEAFYKIVSP